MRTRLIAEVGIHDEVREPAFANKFRLIEHGQTVEAVAIAESLLSPPRFRFLVHARGFSSRRATTITPTNTGTMATKQTKPKSWKERSKTARPNVAVESR